MFIIAVDIGYSNLKTLSGYSGSAPSAMILPAGAGPLTAMPDSLGLGRDDKHLIVTVDDELWAAGVEPSRLQNWERELHPDYPATGSYRALLHAALVVSGRERIDRLVTGLPVSQYQNTAHRERLVAALQGQHQVTARRAVQVDSVEVLPQPAGAYLDMVGHAAANSVEAARTLVIDAGFFSVDWVLFDGGELRSANSGSSTSAMSLLLEAADTLVQHDHGGRLGRDQIEKAVRTGHDTVQLFGTPVQLTPYITAAAKRTGAVALTAVKQSLRSEPREVDVVLLSGGGASVYAEAASAAFPRSRIVVPDEPVLANVRGYWSYANKDTGAAAPGPVTAVGQQADEFDEPPNGPAAKRPARNVTAKRETPARKGKSPARLR
jgi:plasmid segregation protein ParM